MEAVFLKLLNLSLTASLLVLAILLVRLVFRKAPRWLLCLLWGLVALRLIVPFSVESALSLIPSAEPLPQAILHAANPQIQSGVAVVDNAINPVLTRSMAPSPGDSANPVQIWTFVLSWLWLIGAAGMLGYAVGSAALLKRKLRTATRYRKGVKQSELVDSPFVLGIVRPTIYLPYQMDDDDLAHVIAHEQAHIRRRDHWWKPLGFALLAIYWFNPVLWLAYVLLCRDIEAACDEKVVRDMDKDARRAYSRALLRCSVHRRRIAACPLAFGEVSVRKRVRNVMHYRKPAFWLILLAVVVSIVVAVCFLTHRPAAEDSLTYVQVDTAVGQRADFDVDLGRTVKSAVLTAELWQNGQCTSSSPVTVNAQTKRLTLLFSDRRENLNLIGENIQIDTDETAGSLVTYFAFPERVVGWSFTSWRDEADIPVFDGANVILAAMNCDTGSGVRSTSCRAFMDDPARLAASSCVIVVRARFYGEEVPGEIDGNRIESVTVDRVGVSEQARDALVSLINAYDRSHFIVGADDPGILSRAARLNCENGDFYVLHYQYYSGFSFSPAHPGDDDYRSILTYYRADGAAQKAWKMEYDFDTAFKDWLDEFQPSVEAPDTQWDKRPMLVIDGKQYIDPYKPESTLPAGYAPAGTLTAEQAYNTGLEGTAYFTNPNAPDDVYTYQLSGTPVSIDTVDSETRTWQYLRWINAELDTLANRRLTLDDVRWLAQKGEALTWSDFELYQGTDGGSGLYIMQYVIDDRFEVLVGGTPQNEPMYVRLRNRALDTWIDIRTDDVDSFINASISTIGGVDGPTSVEITSAEPDYAALFAAYAQGDAAAEVTLRTNKDDALRYCMTQFDAGVLEGLTFDSTGTEMRMYHFWCSSLGYDSLENEPDSPQQDWEEWSGYTKRIYDLNGYDEAVFTEDMPCSRLYVQMLMERETASEQSMKTEVG